MRVTRHSIFINGKASCAHVGFRPCRIVIRPRVENAKRQLLPSAGPGGKGGGTSDWGSRRLPSLNCRRTCWCLRGTRGEVSVSHVFVYFAALSNRFTSPSWLDARRGALVPMRGVAGVQLDMHLAGQDDKQQVVSR